MCIFLQKKHILTYRYIAAEILEIRGYRLTHGPLVHRIPTSYLSAGLNFQSFSKKYKTSGFLALILNKSSSRRNKDEISYYTVKIHKTQYRFYLSPYDLGILPIIHIFYYFNLMYLKSFQKRSYA